MKQIIVIILFNLFIIGCRNETKDITENSDSAKIMLPENTQQNEESISVANKFLSDFRKWMIEANSIRITDTETEYPVANNTIQNSNLLSDRFKNSIKKRFNNVT